MRIFVEDEERDEDIFAKVVSVAEKAGVTITATYFSTCHRLPSGGKGPKPLITKFAWRDIKHQLMKHKRNLRETSIYLNDDLTPLRAKMTRDLRSEDDVRGDVTAKAKNIKFVQDIQNLVFDIHCKAQRWDNEFFSNACNSSSK